MLNLTNMINLNVIVTGATGMVGEGVLHECLNHPNISKVLIINRKPSGKNHPKLKEIVHTDFFNFSAVEKDLAGYDGCLFCMGVSSVGISPEQYYKLTYELTMHAGETLSRLNPNMTFCYISGAGTDSTEQGRSRWARVKGKTENALMKLPFKDVYAVRPGFIKPTRGLQHAHSFYKYVNWMFPIGRAFFPNGFCTLHELGIAMINLVLKGYEKKVVEGTDIIVLAENK
jgi:uncharacterized protein YbjT (DUF2867 family)